MTGQQARREIGLLSYVRRDDENNQGLITALSQEIEKKIQDLSGENWRIRQDKDFLKVGQRWRKIYAFDRPVFLFAIITPSYVRSGACLEEWEKFEEYEKEFDGKELILPISLIQLHDNVPECGKKVRDRIKSHQTFMLLEAYEMGSLQGRNGEIVRLAKEVWYLSEKLDSSWHASVERHNTKKTGKSVTKPRRTSPSLQQDNSGRQKPALGTPYSRA